MNKKLMHAAFAAVLLSGVSALAVELTATAAVAADTAPKTPKAKKEVAVPLQAAITAAGAKDFKGAQVQIDLAKTAPDLDDFDRAEIDVVQAYVSIGNGDHPAALAAYKRVIASPYFTVVQKPDEQAGAIKNAMLLSNEAKDYAGAVALGEKLAASGQMDDKAAAALAGAYYYNKDYAKARALAQKSIDAAIAANTPPDESALQIVFNSYADQKDQVNARKMLEQILTYYPSPDNWAQLIDNTLSGPLKDMQILSLFRLRVVTGASGDARDYITGSDLAIKNGYPGDARTILQAAQSRGVSGVSGKLAEAKAKAASDEKTLAGNDAQAAKLPNGKLDVLVAEQYYGYGRYAEAEAAAKRAIAKGGVTDPEEPKMVVGMALVGEGKYADAVQAFGQVGGNDSQKKIAHVWTVYAQSKAAAAH